MAVSSSEAMTQKGRWAMVLDAVKVVLSVAVVVAVTELSKKQTWWGAVLASLPLVSLLSLVWLYLDTGDTAKVADLASGVFWLVLPSLALFAALPLLLRAGWRFWPALAVSALLTAALYAGELWLLRRFGVEL